MLPVGLEERYYADGFLSGYKIANGYEKGFPDSGALQRLFGEIDQKIDEGELPLGVAIGIAGILRGPLWNLTIDPDAPENALYKKAAQYLKRYIDMYNEQTKMSE